jgi:hypothetical protein
MPDTFDTTGLNNVWTFWEGSRPAYIELCHDTLRKHVAEKDLHILDYEGVRKWLPELDIDDPYWRSMMYAHQADIIRVKLLEKYGGTWIDADYICLNPFTPLLQTAGRGYLLYYKDGHRPTNGILIARRDHPIISEWSRKLDCVYRNHRRLGIHCDPFHRWTAYGGDQMEAVLRNALEPHADIDWDRVQLIPYKQLSRFFEADGCLEDKIWPGAYGYMLFNTGFPDWFKGLSRDQVLTGPWVISLIFQYALRMKDYQWTATLPTSPSSPKPSASCTPTESLPESPSSV